MDKFDRIQKLHRILSARRTPVASFCWHPDQRAEWQDKTYLLDIPYNDDRELIRTLLGYGEQVEVLGPATQLRPRTALADFVDCAGGRVVVGFGVRGG